MSGCNRCPMKCGEKADRAVIEGAHAKAKRFMLLRTRHYGLNQARLILDTLDVLPDARAIIVAELKAINGELDHHEKS